MIKIVSDLTTTTTTTKQESSCFCMEIDLCQYHWCVVCKYKTTSANTKVICKLTKIFCKIKHQQKHKFHTHTKKSCVKYKPASIELKPTNKKLDSQIFLQMLKMLERYFSFICKLISSQIFFYLWNLSICKTVLCLKLFSVFAKVIFFYLYIIKPPDAFTCC